MCAHDKFGFVLKCDIFKYCLSSDLLVFIVLMGHRFIAVVLVTIVAACDVAGYIAYAQTLAPRLEDYTSVFHMLFEDASHNLLGNLTGQLEIVQTDASTVVSTFTLAFSSDRLSVWHRPYIDRVTFEMRAGVVSFEYDQRTTWGLLPPSQSQSLNDGEKVFFHEASHDISRFEQPMFFICCVLHSCETSNGTIPSIQVYFSDGQVWTYNQNLYPLWQDKYVYPPSAISMKLNELSGKTEATTITLNTVDVIEMAYDFRIFTAIVFLLSGMFIATVYVLHSIRKSKNAREKSRQDQMSAILA